MKERITIFSISSILLLACEHNSNYTSRFSDIEDAIASGLYKKADSILYEVKVDEEKYTIEESMYWNLLRLNMKYVHGTLSGSDLYMAETLKNYYRNTNDINNLSKAYLFVGEVYRSVGNQSDSIRNILTAKELIANQNITILNAWIEMKMGDIYLSENILDKCAEAYKESYYCSLKTNDTLRISLAAYRMAKSFIIKNNVDSAVFFLRKVYD